MTLDRGRAFFDFAQNEETVFMPSPIYLMLSEVEARTDRIAMPLDAIMRIAGSLRALFTGAPRRDNRAAMSRSTNKRAVLVKTPSFGALRAFMC